MNEIEMLFVEETDMTHYGLRVVRVNGDEFAVAESEDEATKAAKLTAGESLWAFNSTFIGSFLGLDRSQRKAIGEMQKKLCEDAQKIVELLIGDRLDEFLDSAIDEDGRGHFLSHYDGEEQDGGDVSPALEGKLLYRI